MKRDLFDSVIEFVFIAIVLLFIMNAFTKLAHAELASWYSTEACKFNPDPKCPTASGVSIYELEKKGDRFAASWQFPFGTRVKVTNQNNGKSVLVTIRDRGPARRLCRAIDLSKSAFETIAEKNKGVINVTLEVVK